MKKMNSMGTSAEATGAPSLSAAYGASRLKKRSITPGSSSNLASDSEDHYSSIADAILKQKRSSDPGEVDIQQNGEESGQAPYDNMNHDAVMKELYDDEQLDPQPMDSNRKGKDMFESIKRKRR